MICTLVFHDRMNAIEENIRIIDSQWKFDGDMSVFLSAEYLLMV